MHLHAPSAREVPRTEPSARERRHPRQRGRTPYPPTIRQDRFIPNRPEEGQALYTVPSLHRLACAEAGPRRRGRNSRRQGWSGWSIWGPSRCRRIPRESWAPSGSVYTDVRPTRHLTCRRLQALLDPQPRQPGRTSRGYAAQGPTEEEEIRTARGASFIRSSPPRKAQSACWATYARQASTTNGGTPSRSISSSQPSAGTSPVGNRVPR